MDLVPLVNGLSNFAPNGQTLLLFSGVILITLWLTYSQFGKQLGKRFHDVMFTNWRLGLLALTGLVLSLASGWTTWDGMRNFTREPLLSLMITFGIQGVMLIVAWLIGESFATGMNHRPHRQGMPTNAGLRVLQPIASSIAGIMLFSAIAIVSYSYFALPSVTNSDPARAAFDWWDELAIAAPIILLLVLLIVNAGSDVLDDYVQSLRIMVRSAVLWVMFLACMATSVFFSFDSLFSTIFPKEERKRAAELRAQNQVAGVVNDIGSLAVTRRLAEQDALFATESWQRYDGNLDRLTRVATGAESKLQKFFEERMRERQSVLNRHQEDKASAETQQVQFVQRKGVLNNEIGRVKEQATRLAPEVERLKGLVFDKDREIIAKKAEAEAEAGGIGVTSRAGRGPKFREISGQLNRLREEKKNLELQLREFEGRLNRARDTITKSESELRRIDGEIAKLRGRAETATRLIATRRQDVTEAPSFDPTNGLQQLTKAREEFRRNPTAKGLSQVQGICTTLVAAMSDAPTLKADARTIDCDPGTASEAASRVFALNVGIVALQQNCIGGNRLPTTGGADALFAFARRCVQDSGLPSRDTDALRQQINTIELNRDDKAHRFVVTSNAFGDGNKLAYLALAIAIAIDTLVFMSGLFGANAVRSPLSDVPSHKGRTARQLEDVIENALLPDKFENATHALESIQPASGMVPRELGLGWTHEAVVSDAEMGAKLRVLKVLNAGATIGAVRRDETYPARYFIRSELLEFLNQVAKNAFESDKEKVRLSELRKIVTVALQPYVSDHADIVLGHMHPISDRSGFSSEVFMSEVPGGDVPIVQRALNAGATLDYVLRDDRKEERDRFYVHKEFYRTLATLSAEFPKHGRRLNFDALPSPGPTQLPELAGGNLTPAAPAAITSQVATPESDPEPAVPPVPSAIDTASQEDVRQAYLDHLITSLGIEPEAYLKISGPAFGPAMATSEAFYRQQASNALLQKGIQDRDADARRTFENAYEKLASQLRPTDSWQRQMLDDAHEEIEQNWSILMLLPNGPYETLFEQMIAAYESESGDGSLTADETGMLRVARLLRGAIQTNPRDTATAWAKLEDQFSGAGDKMAAESVVPLNSRRA